LADWQNKIPVPFNSKDSYNRSFTFAFFFFLEKKEAKSSRKKDGLRLFSGHRHLNSLLPIDL
jgi:hypothetical protein